MNEERVILDGLLRGDRNAARVFFERYGGLIRHAVRSIRVKSDTFKDEDLFNGAIEHLFSDEMKSLRMFGGRCSLGSYLYTVCRRYALSVAGKENPLADWCDGDALLEAVPAPEDVAPDFSEAQKRALKETILKQDRNTQLFVKMVLLDNRSTDDVMRFFGWGSANTVYAMKNKILLKLKKAVRKKMVRKVVDDVA